MAAKLLTRLRQLHAPQNHHRILHSFRLLSRNSISTSPPLPPTQTPPPLPPPTPGNAGETRRKSSSLKEHELAKFSAIADTWKNPQFPKPFEGLQIVDVGCGGGILSEPLARLGATVTGVDAVDKNIKIASFHSDLDPSISTIEYICTTAEKLVEEGRQFDAVMALEVIEHVAEPAEFCKSLAALTRPGGAIVISTINRSLRAYAAAIVAAEYILHWLPRGTHQWSSFLTPEELAMILKGYERREITKKGMKEAPISGDFETEKKVGCCSSVCARVCEFLLILMILVLSTAYITSMNYPLGIDCSYHHHHHHHHYLEFDSYPVAFLRRTQIINGTPSHFQVAEPAAAATTENKEIAQGDAAMHDVSEIEGEDLSPEASSSVAAAKPLIRKMVHDYDDDGNSTSSIVQMIVVTAIGSGMVLLVLISCMLVRKRRNAVAGYYHHQRHVEPSLVRRQDPVMPERWSSVIDKRARSHGGM